MWIEDRKQIQTYSDDVLQICRLMYNLSYFKLAAIEATKVTKQITTISILEIILIVFD